MLRLALLILAALGLILLVRGLRGRRVGSALYCRCGYCLEGLDRPKTCPECAAAVWDPIYTRRGAIERAPRLAWTGAVLLILGSLAWFSLRLAAPPGTNPYSWQPDRLLTLQSPDNGTNGQWFAREIEDRLEAGTLSTSQRAALASRARARIDAQQWRHDAPGYPSASAWVSIYAALWRSGTVTDEQLLNVLDRAFTCRASAGQQTISTGSGENLTTSQYAWVMFAVRGPLRGITRTSTSFHGVALNGEFAFTTQGSARANATGDLEGGQGHNLTLALATLTQTNGCQIQICFPLDRVSVAGGQPPPASPHAFWVITLNVSAIDPTTGLPSEVTLHHHLADEDPVASAHERMMDRRQQEFFERLRREHEARQSATQSAPPSPSP